MQSKDASLFRLLKQEIVAAMRLSYPAISEDISHWKGQEITDFQEDLSRKVNEHISEKWFYTHMKSQNSTLPRIDVLNFLSKYAGYANWDEFKHQNEKKTIKQISGIRANRYFIIVPALTIGILAILILVFKFSNTREYKICFYDADTREQITNNIIEVSLLIPDESPLFYICDQQGCLLIKTDQSIITMVVKTPYYQTDTIIRTLNRSQRDEKVLLQPNNYALMIHYFSRMNIKDWKKRRDQLDRMIDNDAIIYQVLDDGGIGMELYSKLEFINILTMPTNSLKHIEILDSKFRNGKISLLRFRQRGGKQ